MRSTIEREILGVFILCMTTRIALVMRLKRLLTPSAPWNLKITVPYHDWVLDELQTPCHPQQIEFARLNISYTVLSKRKLLKLATGGFVEGWDDPRMPTIAGLRRRGYVPEAIRSFCEKIGVAKADSVVDIALARILSTRRTQQNC